MSFQAKFILPKDQNLCFYFYLLDQYLLDQYWNTHHNNFNYKSNMHSLNNKNKPDNFTILRLLIHKQMIIYGAIYWIKFKDFINYYRRSHDIFKRKEAFAIY